MLTEFIKLNVNMDMITKNVKCTELKIVNAHQTFFGNSFTKWIFDLVYKCSFCKQELPKKSLMKT